MTNPSPRSTRTRKPSKRLADHAYDPDATDTNQSDGDEFFADSGNGQPAKPKGRPRGSARRTLQANGAATSIAEPEYIATMRMTFGRQQKILLNAALRAVRVVENERDEARGEKNFIQVQSHRRWQEQEEKLSIMREAGLKRIQELGLEIETDEDVRARLQHFMSKIKNWVKRYGAAGPATNLSDKTINHILTALTTTSPPFTSKPALNRALEQGISATTLLNAIFAKFLYERLLGNIFFFLKDLTDERYQADLGSALHVIQDLGREVDRDRANMWFSQTMAMLHSKKCFEKGAESQDMSKVDVSKKKCYASFTSAFLSSEAVKLLLRTMTEAEGYDMISEANLIIESFGNYLLLLSTQKVRMQLLSFDKVTNMPFSIGSEYTRPHSTLRLEADDHTLDNHSILLVVEPCVQAFGNEEGRDYENFKIWAPAVVIVAFQKATPQKPVPSRKKTQSKQVESRNVSDQQVITARDKMEIMNNFQVNMGKRSAPGGEGNAMSSKRKRSCQIISLDGASVSYKPMPLDDDDLGNDRMEFESQQQVSAVRPDLAIAEPDIKPDLEMLEMKHEGREPVSCDGNFKEEEPASIPQDFWQTRPEVDSERAVPNKSFLAKLVQSIEHDEGKGFAVMPTGPLQW